MGTLKYTAKYECLIQDTLEDDIETQRHTSFRPPDATILLLFLIPFESINITVSMAI